MNKSEAKFQTVFNHWLRHVFFDKQRQRGGFAFELKHTRGKNYLPFSAVKDHQLKALLAAENEGLIYKISDESRGHKPFDCFALRLAPTFIVIKYPGFFAVIDAEVFAYEKTRTPKKSLTAERAKNIARFVQDLA
jgi:hypothetical protein